MSIKLSKYGNTLNNHVKKTSINHVSRATLHNMNKEQLEEHYAKYYSEQANIECCLNLNNEFEQIDKEELERYEKWLMESD